jgi:hypothetical protein
VKNQKEKMTMHQATTTETQMNFAEVCSHYRLDVFDQTSITKLKLFEGFGYHRAVSLTSAERKQLGQETVLEGALFKYFVVKRSASKIDADSERQQYETSNEASSSDRLSFWAKMSSDFAHEVAGSRAAEKPHKRAKHHRKHVEESV